MGLAAAGLALVLRLPLIAVVLVAAAATALARLSSAHPQDRLDHLAGQRVLGRLVDLVEVVGAHEPLEPEGRRARAR